MNSLPSRFTLNDIEVGSTLYDALISHAISNQGTAIFYSDLLALARQMHPDDAVLGRAVSIGIGNKLLFVECFCDANGYPNLACLAVNRTTRKPGPGYKRDWAADKREVGVFDWSIATPNLPIYAQQIRAALPRTRMPRRTDAQAREALFAHYNQDRLAYATVSQSDKEEIVNLLMEGIAPDVALLQVLSAKAQFSEEE